MEHKTLVQPPQKELVTIIGHKRQCRRWIFRFKLFDSIFFLNKKK